MESLETVKTVAYVLFWVWHTLGVCSSAMSTFSPLSSWSSSGMKMCVCVCVCGWNELEVCTTLALPHINSFRTMPVLYTSPRTHTHILKPFEDSEPTGLKVDIACSSWHVCEMGGFTGVLLGAPLKVYSHLQGDHSEEWSQGPSHLWHGPKHASAAGAIRTATSAKPQNQRQHQFWDRWWFRRDDV